MAEENVIDAVSDPGFGDRVKEILAHELKIIKLPPALNTVKI